MTSIVFKAKAQQMFDHNDNETYLFVDLPKTFKSSHLQDKNSHRMFSGNVSEKIIDVRVKKILNEMKIYQINLSDLPKNVKAEGSYMITISIEI